MSREFGTGHFVKGAAILGVAGLISKLLGAVYRIPYQNIAGDIGLYVYMQVYPLYTALLILATAGFPIAISKLVSERLAVGDEWGARRAFRISSAALGGLGLFFFVLLYTGAPLIARIMGDEQLVLPLRAVAWSLPLVPLVAIMRGYFQGHQNMMPTGVSQVAEQLVRVTVILITAYGAMTFYQDAYLAGSGAVFAALPGAFAALIVLLWYWRKQRVSGSLMPLSTAGPGGFGTASEAVSNRQILLTLLYYALPICLGALVLPLIPLVDSVTVVNMLQWSGVQEEAAKVLKGVFDRGQPLIQFGSFFATSLSLALVPSISEAVAQGRTDQVAVRTTVALRLTVLLGLPASVGLALLAEPVNIMLYGDPKGTEALAVQAFTILFATLSITTSGVLQGLGKVMLPARHLFYGVVVKLLLNLALVPVLGITGAAVATVAAYVTSTLFNLFAIRRHIGVSVPYRQVGRKPLAAVVIMAGCVLAVEWGMVLLLVDVASSIRLGATIVGLTAVAAGAVVYGLALFWTGGLTRDDLRQIPRGERLAARLTRWRLLRETE